jgi:hypothetical protein
MFKNIQKGKKEMSKENNKEKTKEERSQTS